MIRAACVLCVCVWSFPAHPCTTFLLEDAEGHPFVGKSYDWSVSEGRVLLNKKGVAKQAVSLNPLDTSLTWVSEHASVTFNQYGRELPNGGMNDAGLVLEIMWLSSAEYPDRDERPSVGELQWIQYALDSFSTTAELIEHAPRIRVSPIYADVHYLACDRSSTCAAFEYIEGELVITHGDALVAPVLTNHTYAESADYLESLGSDPVPGGPASLDRFARAARVTRHAAKSGREASFALLDEVSQGDYSVWNIVYAPDTLEVFFRTHESSEIKSLKLTEVEATCSTPVSLVDIDIETPGDIAPRLQTYTTDDNASLIRSSVAETGIPIPDALIEAIATYPERLPCQVTD